MHGVHAADGELQLGLCRAWPQASARPSSLGLQRRDPGGSRGEPQPDPGKLKLAAQIPRRGGRGQYRRVRNVVELVGQHGRDNHDPGHDERGPPGRVRRARRLPGPVELPGHCPAHTDTELPGRGRRERNLAHRAQPGEPARQDRHPVLAEQVAIEAAHQATGRKRIVHPPVNDRNAARLTHAALSRTPGRAAILVNRRQERTRNVDEDIAGVDRRQVSAVGRGRAAAPASAPSATVPEQPADQRHRQRCPPGTAAGRPPPVPRRGHRASAPRAAGLAYLHGRHCPECRPLAGEAAAPISGQPAPLLAPPPSSFGDCGSKLGPIMLDECGGLLVWGRWSRTEEAVNAWPRGQRPATD